MDELRNEVGVNLLDFEGDTYERLSNDPGVLGRLFYHLLKDQITAANLTPRQFAEGFRGQTLTDAFDALTDEIVVFLPPTKAKVLKTVLQKLRQADTILTQYALEAANGLDPAAIARRTLGTPLNS